MDSMLQLFGAIGSVGALFVGVGFLADYWREDYMGYQKIALQGMMRFRLSALTGAVIVMGLAEGAAFATMETEFVLKFVAILFLVVEVLFLIYLLSWQRINRWGWLLLAGVLVPFLLGVAISKIFIWSQIILGDTLKSPILILAIIALVRGFLIRDFLKFIVPNNELNFYRVLIEASLIFFVACTFWWKCWDWLERLAPGWVWIIVGTALLWLGVIFPQRKDIFAALWKEWLLEEEGNKKRWEWIMWFYNAILVLSVALVSLLVGDIKVFDEAALDNVVKVTAMLVVGLIGMLSLLEILVLDEFPRKVRLHYPEGMLPEECWLIDIDREFYYVVVTPHPELQDSIRVETRAKDKVKRIVFLRN